ncbi:hypothetical protein SAY87_024437 [Trapa incisa]|uniref:RRM domain-containing protein n=1 Tax=Trapa incisa TaxID=236973 RepID=A0AAN7GP72_9MYRT|nr:hypothetical protein SAY87_024437 [Trapa incisa]
MASSKALNPSASPFFPVALQMPPAFGQLWHQPHGYSSIVDSWVGKRTPKRGATYFCRRRLEKLPRWGTQVSTRLSKEKLARVDLELRDGNKMTSKNSITVEPATGDGDNDKPPATDDEASGLRGKTTIMIRHIPNMLKRQDLIEILDEHCHEVNGSRTQLQSAYDFVYLPMDYARKANKGYAFVNFTTPEAAIRMWRIYNGLKWAGLRRRDVIYRSKKVCEICAATTQGKAKLEEILRQRTFPREEYQPVVAVTAPRDGVNGAPVTLVGKCSSKRPQPR